MPRNTVLSEGGEGDTPQHTTQEAKRPKQSDVPPGCVLVKMKDTGRYDVKSKQQAEALISRGHAEGIYPEGTV